MSGRVQDRVIVVTGAAGGQGAAEVLALHREGAVVIATDIADTFPGEAPERVHRRRLDVARPEEWEALAQWARSQFGRVDGLITPVKFIGAETSRPV